MAPLCIFWLGTFLESGNAAFSCSNPVSAGHAEGQWRAAGGARSNIPWPAPGRGLASCSGVHVHAGSGSVKKRDLQVSGQRAAHGFPRLHPVSLAGMQQDRNRVLAHNYHAAIWKKSVQ